MNTPMDPVRGEPRVEAILEKEYQPMNEPAAPDRVAIIVNHGMGQQVPFETLELVAEAVWRAATTHLKGLQPAPPREFTTGAHGTPARPEIRTVRLGTKGRSEVETELTRVEMTFTDANQNPHEVHFYEAYWAPLTEGSVTIRNVIAFLIQSGWDGLRNSGVGRTKRWMFGGWQEFELNWVKQCGFYLYIVVLVVSLIILNSVIAAAAVSHAIGASSSFPAKEHLDPLTSDFLVADITGFLIFLATFAIPRVHKAPSAQILRRPLVWLQWLLMIPGLLVVPILGYLMLAQLSGFRPENHLWPWALSWATWINNRWPIATSSFWGLAVLGAAAVRWALIEFGGDVVAYIAAHTVNKFWGLRKQIWEVAMKVARAVYRAQDPRNNFYYSRVVILGHSLGSVIAYDVLNGMLLEEGFSAQPLQIARRTRMFITLGSPLDKTAFVFRNQADADSEIREVAAAAVQPMIADYRYRPQEWVNIYSRADIFADPLEYYDENKKLLVPENNEDKKLLMPENASRRVWNLKDPDAQTPLVAHTEYWHGDLLATQLYRAITT